MGWESVRINSQRYLRICFQCRHFGGVGQVQRTNSAPFQWKPIGIARGNSSGPTYANRAGIFDCISSCANGSLRTRATSCCCIMTPSRHTQCSTVLVLGLAWAFHHMPSSSPRRMVDVDKAITLVHPILARAASQ